VPPVSRKQEFSPCVNILPAAQRRLWTELRAIPKEFVLYAGTAIALRLGHRHSVDFDLFGDRSLDIPRLEAELEFLDGAKVIQREPNTLSVIVDRDGPVKLSFFGVPRPPRLAAPGVARDNGLQIASLLDLAGTKVSVLQIRAEAKDYIDIEALMRLGGIGLPAALSAAQVLYGSFFNPQITLKALSYFDDGDLRNLPENMKRGLAAAARAVDLDRLPSISSGSSRDAGLGL
jgi:hypothetical protein